jgi:hypothetical protein
MCLVTLPRGSLLAAHYPDISLLGVNKRTMKLCRGFLQKVPFGRRRFGMRNYYLHLILVPFLPS